MAKTLIEVLTENEIELQDSSGGRMVARCMFHQGDHEASFTIYPNDTYFCFGCEVWGDAVKFLVDYKHMSSTEALEYVGHDYKFPKADKAKVIKVKNSLASFRFLYSIAEQYHEFLMNSPGPQRYLETRGLTLETIKKYKLGYTDGRVLNLTWAWEHELASEMGLINKSGFEQLSHRITIPNLTDAGQSDFIIGRTVTNDKIKYLGARMPKPIMGWYELRHSPVFFLVEGQFDWLTLRQWGFPSVVIGGSHLTQANLSLIRDRRIVIVPDYDPEDQGMKTAERLKQQLPQAEILNYEELKTDPGKFDISTLAESPGGQMLFTTVVKEQMPWITLMSQRILAKWFPTLADTMPSHSTLRQPALTR